MKTQLAVFCLLVSASASAFASSWHWATFSNDETQYFFDADTVEKNREIVTVWVKTVEVKGPSSSGTLASAQRWRMDCMKRTLQVMAASTYDKDGKFIRSFQAADKPEVVLPDSTGEAMLKVACAPDFPKDKSGKLYIKLEDNDVFRATRTWVEIRNSQKDSAPQ